MQQVTPTTGMAEEAVTTSLKDARRLAVTKQHLTGVTHKVAAQDAILSVIRDLAFVQWDPISIVAPSHHISLWSREDRFRPRDLERLLWEERSVFEHWMPIASLVLTEDYPIYHSLMKRYPESLCRSWGSQREAARKFLKEHAELRRRMLRDLRGGPLQPSQFGDYVKTKRNADGWTSGSIVSNMLFHLHMSGDVMVVGHDGNQNIWGLSEEFLPPSVEKGVLTGEELESETAMRAISALGTASPREVTFYFVRGRYNNLKPALGRLEKESAIRRVHVGELGTKDERYICERDIPLLESVAGDEWHPRVSLISPFDNLICGRERTSRVFGFDYVHEQFLPREKRRFGTYVMPILWGDSLIGRLDPVMDKENQRLIINSVHAESGESAPEEAAPEIAGKVEQFADFLGATEVVYTRRVPAPWREFLR